MKPVLDTKAINLLKQELVKKLEEIVQQQTRKYVLAGVRAALGVKA